MQNNEIGWECKISVVVHTDNSQSQVLNKHSLSHVRFKEEAPSNWDEM